MNFRNLAGDLTLALVTTKLKLAEKSKIIYEEQPNYTKEELLADIGGALGLFLGLNLLDLLLFLGQLLKILITKILLMIAHIKVTFKEGHFYDHGPFPDSVSVTSPPLP